MSAYVREAFVETASVYETLGSSKGCLASEPSWNCGLDSLFLISRWCVLSPLLISGCAPGSVLSVECSYWVLHLLWCSFSSGGGRVRLVVVIANDYDIFIFPPC